MFLRLHLPKIHRPPSLALMAQLAAFTLGAGVIAAASYGFGVSSHPDTPQECTAMATTAERAFVAYENLATSTHLAATRGRTEFARHEADVVSLRGELDDLGPAYRAARAECVGGVR